MCGEHTLLLLTGHSELNPDVDALLLTATESFTFGHKSLTANPEVVWGIFLGVDDIIIIATPQTF